MIKQKQEQPVKQHNLMRNVSASDLGFDATAVAAAPVAVSLWVRSLLQNWRQGTVAVKDRSEVAFSGKKPWKQKGTGQARAGTKASPLWRKGGITWGPQERVRSLTVTKKTKKQALRYILNAFIEQGRILAFDWQIQGDVPKTAQAAKLLKEAGLENNKIVLFVPADDFITYASFANIPSVRLLFLDQANAYDLINTEYWVCLDKDIQRFKEMVMKWI
jgi:large subunit ribosomal protein L4